MSPPVQLLLDAPQGTGYAFRDRLASELETSAAVPRAVVREPQKVESLRSSLPPLAAVGLREPSELDEPGLVRVDSQIEAPEALRQCIHESLRVVLVLEAHHEVVGISNDDGLAVDLVAAPLLLNPQVEDEVQVNVGQDRIWEPYGYGNLSPCER